jgi:transcription initiation factor IIE alpha subunit
MGLRYKVLRKGGENMKQNKLICPECKADLTLEDAIENIRTGVQKNTLSFNAKNGWFDFREYEFESDGIFEEFNCARCGAEVSKAIENFM